jgi:methyl-accepting chemotaxis protein
MTLRAKLLAMTIVTVLALAILFSVLLINGKQQMLNDREDKVRNLVEATLGILSH